jgi:hypothetical protein
MPRVCTVCSSQHHQQVDADLIAGIAYRTIAITYGLGVDSVKRHAKNHLSTAMVVAAEAATVAAGDGLVAALQELREDAERLMSQAENDGDYATALRGVRERLRLIQIAAELDGSYQDRKQDSRVRDLEAELARYKETASQRAHFLGDWLTRDEFHGCCELDTAHAYLVDLAKRRAAANDPTLEAADFGRDYYANPHDEGRVTFSQRGRGKLTDDCRPWIVDLLLRAQGYALAGDVSPFNATLDPGGI